MEVSGSLYGGNGSSVPITVESQADNAARVLTRIAQVTLAQRRLYLAISYYLAYLLNYSLFVFCLHYGLTS